MDAEDVLSKCSVVKYAMMPASYDTKSPPRGDNIRPTIHGLQNMREGPGGVDPLTR